MIYVHIADGVVDNRAEWDGAIPDSWPRRNEWVQSDVAQIGWTYDGTTFSAPPPPAITPEQQRILNFFNDPDQLDMVSRLRTAPDAASIDTWLAANVTTLAQARKALGMIFKIMVANRLV